MVNGLKQGLVSDVYHLQIFISLQQNECVSTATLWSVRRFIIYKY